MDERLATLERAEYLERELKQLKLLKSEDTKRKKNCKHDVVVVAKLSDAYHMEAKCLYCGKLFHKPEDLRNVGSILRMFQFKWEVSAEAKYQFGAELLKKELKLFPNLSDEELVKNINEKYFDPL